MKWLRLLAALALAGCNTSATDDTGDDTTTNPKADLSANHGDGGGSTGGDTDGGPEDLSPPDNSGPTITFVTPKAGAFVGGILSIDVQITDATGVDDTTVHIIVGASNGNKGVELNWARAAGTDHYVGVMDTAKLATQFVLPVISVTARDTAKNYGDLLGLGNLTTAAEEVILDTVGPSVSLDPPDMHIVQVTLNKIAVSRPFDPVGYWSANDGDLIRQLQYFRARVEDNGNYAPGQKVAWISLVKPGSVKLFVAPLAYGPLVVDTNSDTICDDINPDLVPAVPGMGGNMGKATMVDFDKISIGGGADYVPLPGQFVDVPGLGLLEIGDPQVLLHPKPICNNDLLVHIGYSFNYLEPALWGIPPVIAPPSPACEGFQFDAANSMIPEGPLCAAVVATDNAGNRSVSAPLSLCFDQGNGKCAGYSDRDNNGGPATGEALAACKPACRSGARMNVPINGDNLLPFFQYPGDNFLIVQQ